MAYDSCNRLNNASIGCRVHLLLTQRPAEHPMTFPREFQMINNIWEAPVIPVQKFSLIMDWILIQNDIPIQQLLYACERAHSQQSKDIFDLEIGQCYHFEMNK